MEPHTSRLARRHFLYGWWSLLLFLTAGIVLEAMHGLKIGWYLDAGNETRRLLLTLGHAHGTLLALVHIAFAATLRLATGLGERATAVASPCLAAASILLPGGFFAGGTWIFSGDPGVGIFLVPLGALALFVGVLAIATATLSRSPESR